VFTGALTFAYMTKLFVTLFVEKGEGVKDEKRYISFPSAIALAVSAAIVPLFGTFTGIMDALADVGEDFFHGNVPDYIIPYFTWANIRSSLVSVAIGAVIYLVVVRGFMMKRELRRESRQKMHVDRLPEWFDLENLIYRPLLKLSTLNALLRPSGHAPHTPGRFLSRYYIAFSRRVRAIQESPTIVGHFSLDLLFMGLGVVAAIVYLLIRS
jgi:hypothetical protein